jgi:hypothetical protein
LIKEKLKIEQPQTIVVEWGCVHVGNSSDDGMNKVTRQDFVTKQDFAKFIH